MKQHVYGKCDGRWDTMLQLLQEAKQHVDGARMLSLHKHCMSLIDKHHHGQIVVPHEVHGEFEYATSELEAMQPLSCSTQPHVQPVECPLGWIKKN